MLGEYDLKKLEKAEKLIDEVYSYNFGDPKNKKIVNRLETILHKLGEIQKIQKEEK